MTYRRDSDRRRKCLLKTRAQEQGRVRDVQQVAPRGQVHIYLPKPRPVAADARWAQPADRTDAELSA